MDTGENGLFTLQDCDENYLDNDEFLWTCTRHPDEPAQTMLSWEEQLDGDELKRPDLFVVAGLAEDGQEKFVSGYMSVAPDWYHRPEDPARPIDEDRYVHLERPCHAMDFGYRPSAVPGYGR